MVSGSARKVRETYPPKVAQAQAATKTTKKAIPSAIRAPCPIGSRGRSIGTTQTLGTASAGPFEDRPKPGGSRLLNEAFVDGAVDIRHLLDDADLEEQLAGLLQEGLQLAREEFPVGLAVL